MNLEKSESFVDKWKKRKQYYLDKQKGSPSTESIENIESMPNSIREKQQLKRKPKGSWKKYGKMFMFGFGGFFAVAGILTSIMWPVITDAILLDVLALTPGSSVYEGWSETPIPVYFRVYMWNWTNPETSLRGPDKPIFEQLGPYTFLKHQVKQNIIWNDNDTVTYQIQDQYKNFIPEMSNGSLSDRITNLNVVTMIIGWYCRNLSWFEKAVVNNLITLVGAQLVKTDTVDNLLFSGSEDPVLNILNKLKRFITDIPLTDKFGWLYTVNYSSTADGVYNMYTGKNDLTKLGLASAWNYSNKTVFSGDCGVVNGSFGELYPPHTYSQDKVYLFGYAACSSGAMHRDGFSSVAGIPTAVYIGKADSFDNKSACFCPSDGACPASGARDMSKCVGIPIYLSWPHFYLADPIYREMIVGMNPDPQYHQLRFEMSDVTAATVTGRFKTQTNILMQPIENMALFKNVQQIVMPMFWVSQDADLTSDTLSEMYWLVNGVRWGGWMSLGVGVVGSGIVITAVIVQNLHCFGL